MYLNKRGFQKSKEGSQRLFLLQFSELTIVLSLEAQIPLS